MYVEATNVAQELDGLPNYLEFKLVNFLRYETINCPWKGKSKQVNLLF